MHWWFAWYKLLSRQMIFQELWRHALSSPSCWCCSGEGSQHAGDWHSSNLYVSSAGGSIWLSGLSYWCALVWLFMHPCAGLWQVPAMGRPRSPVRVPLPAPTPLWESSDVISVVISHPALFSLFSFPGTPFIWIFNLLDLFSNFLKNFSFMLSLFGVCLLFCLFVFISTFREISSTLSRLGSGKESEVQVVGAKFK